MTGTRRSGNPGRRIAAFVVGLGRRFYADQCLMRASALAYTSLLSIVPLLALMFAVLKGLGVQHRLEPLLLSRLSLDQQTTDLIIGYIDRTNVSTLGALGAATLVLTVVSVLGTIEASFNYIWRVTRPRTRWRQVTDYLGVVLLTPFLLLAAVAITSAGQVQTIVHWVLANGYVGGVAMTALELAPIVINAVGIGILYAVMPNRHAAWGPIAVSALIAGVAWQLVQWSYVSLQVGVANNNAIYGALAQLPVTLVWLYVSWTIVLGGAEIAAALELGPSAAADSAVDRLGIALHLLVRAADAFEGGGPGIETLAIARELRVDLEVVEHVGETLQAFGWLVAAEGPQHRLVLARAPAGIALGQLSSLAARQRLPRRCDARVRALLATVAAQRGELWNARTLADVLAGGGERNEARSAPEVRARAH